MNKCPCSVCGEDVSPEQQYMIGHELGSDGTVRHTVTHFDCLVKPEKQPEHPPAPGDLGSIPL